jgi:hypothetical protein
MSAKYEHFFPPTIFTLLAPVLLPGFVSSELLKGIALAVYVVKVLQTELIAPDTVN